VDLVQPLLTKHPGFRLWSEAPPNGEPALELLGEDRLTPTELFYVRCHGPIPVLETSHRLVVDGLVERPLELGVDELRVRFPRAETTATLHCAGNRRIELAEVAPIDGETPWHQAAIGNARWAGVRLCDVLAAAGVGADARHVELVGADESGEFGDGAAFGGSVPLAAALEPRALLAFEMNGEPLPREHGFPLRAIVPGYIGARSVKWLERITVLAEPSRNPFHARSYKVFPPDVTAADADWERAAPLGESLLNSVICRVDATGASGWACAGGDRVVERVEVGVDGAWRAAELVGKQVPGAWRLWRTRLDLPPGDHELVVRAWDSSGATQPEHVAPLWNFKGYANNAWHRVRVSVP
jgi:sulfite oxidase